MKALTIGMLSILIANPAVAPLEENQVEKTIFVKLLKNKPTLEKEFASDLAEAINLYSSKYNLAPEKLIAIFMQESGYTLNTINHTKDYSIGQINIRTIKHYKLDKKRLLTDMHYSVEASARILYDLKASYGHKERDYWTRYHSFTPARRKTYKRLVERYML